MQAQLDLSVEHSNIQRFTANFLSDPTVAFPTVFHGLCTDSCLVETWEEGESLRDFFFRVDAATLAQSHPTLDFHRHRSRSQLSPLLREKRSTTELLDRMSADEILQLSRDLGVAGAQAFLKMLIRDNFVHVRQPLHCIFTTALPS
jgi:predicted unusual protein kinase regulating ubiquinone biosynthesis (AarF/ABC1/UbiB family)